ncbi:MAG: DUF2318 domain-containing protein [Nanoarchaeota archaeon]|nr:DUF2318 domain-containing protein [Nanoarchaeota archaeon]
MKKTIIILLALFTLLVTGCSSSITGDAVLDEDTIQIPISEISSTLTKYTLDYNGKEITYFAVLGTDGIVRTAFDGCDICGGYKGYSQRGTDVVCINCGKVFSIDDLGKTNTGGGCWPTFLDHEIEGDYIVISKSDIEDKAYMF